MQRVPKHSARTQLAASGALLPLSLQRVFHTVVQLILSIPRAAEAAEMSRSLATTLEEKRDEVTLLDVGFGRGISPSSISAWRPDLRAKPHRP